VQRRRLFAFGLAGALALAGLGYFIVVVRYPSDRTPEGAYLRIAKAVNQGRPRDVFPYVETAAQHAAYTIRDYRRDARARVLSAYPEPDRTRLASQYEAEAGMPDGSDLFALYADRRGWVGTLRRDLSGISKVDAEGERATVETARGTRYAFRRRENGIWGLTLFTAALVAEAEKAARDFAIIDKAAGDYEHARSPRDEAARQPTRGVAP
jgi:hypothetical protein